MITMSLLLLTVLSATVAALSDTPEIFKRGAGFCWKTTYGRGVGMIPTDCPGRQYDAGLCYPFCQEGFYGVGPVCWQSCPSGYVDDGAFCRQPKPLHIFAKATYGRGVGAPMGCAPHLQMDAGLCYPKCADGFYGVGPVCWRACTGIRSYDCGAGCSDSANGCAEGILNMVTAVAELAVNIISLAMTAGASAAVSMVKVPAMTAAALATAKTNTKNMLKDAAKEVGKDLAEDAATNLANEIVEKGYNMQQIDWSNVDPTGVAAVVKAFNRPNC
jgi:hypothetical protein